MPYIRGLTVLSSLCCAADIHQSDGRLFHSLHAQQNYLRLSIASRMNSHCLHEDVIIWSCFPGYLTFVRVIHQSEHCNGLMQERRNSIANALELRLSCTNPSIRDHVAYPTGSFAVTRLRLCNSLLRGAIVSSQFSLSSGSGWAGNSLNRGLWMQGCP